MRGDVEAGGEVELRGHRAPNPLEGYGGRELLAFAAALLLAGWSLRGLLAGLAAAWLLHRSRAGRPRARRA